MTVPPGPRAAMPNIVLIANPSSTRARHGLADAAATALRPLGLTDVLRTTAAGDGARLARDAVASGAQIVVSVGGDGLVNEIAGVLAGGDVVLAPLPAGSTNVFSRAIGWPAKGDQALQRLVGRLERGAEASEVVLGEVRADGESRAFTVNAGVGLDAEAVAIVEANPALKHRLGHLGFALAAVAGHRRAVRDPFASVSVDGAEPVAVRALAVACGGPYAFVGSRPLDLVPGPSHEGGLGWIGVTDVRARHVLGIVAGAARGGGHVDRPDVLYGTGAHEIRLKAPTPVPVQADGEPLGRHRSVVLVEGPRLRVLRG